ncbi:MAG: DUF3857 domain-containing protein [Cyclobacteriaceae bacterium]
MKSFILGLGLALISFILSGQKPPVKFGDVSKEELSMTTYDKDSTAPAVILADYGESVIVYRQNEGFSLDFLRITRIKILTPEGLSYGDFPVHLYKSENEEEKVSGLKAVTYNLENGNIVESKVKNEGILKENYDANWNIVKVTCPNVRKGSVVEITYKISSPFFFNFRDWSFQAIIPTVISEYRAQVPEYFHYDRYLQGYVPLSVVDEIKTPNSIRITSFERQNQYGSQTKVNTDQIDLFDFKSRWVATDVPAFRQEPHMTSTNNYISKINFELSFIQYPNQPIKKFMVSRIWNLISRVHSSIMPSWPSPMALIPCGWSVPVRPILLAIREDSPVTEKRSLSPITARLL